MKTMKKSVSLLLVFAMCLSLLMGIGPVTAHAAAEQSDVYLIGYPRDGDANYDGDWGHPSLTYMNGWGAGRSTTTIVRAMGSYDGTACYCIEPGVHQDTGDTYNSRGEDYWNNYPSDWNSTIDGATIKLLIGRILQYGYTGQISLNWRSQRAEDADRLSHLVATQLLVWETIVGERDADFNHVTVPAEYDSVKEIVSDTHPLRERIFAYYNSIAASVQAHTDVPSFCGQTVEMQWDGSQYIATLTDTNGILAQFSFSASKPGIQFAVSGNDLIVTAAEAPGEPVTITASKNNSMRRGVVTWSDDIYGPDGGIQDVVCYTQSVSDPVEDTFTVTVSFGGVKIVKTSEDGVVEGITFRITGEGIDQTVTTGANGEIQIDNLVPGEYVVAEQTYDKYNLQEPQHITVVNGQTATVTFSNTLRRGHLSVTKTAEDGLNEGITFHLYGTSLSGHTVDEYAVTDSKGIAYFENVLIGSGYTLEEVGTAARYVIPDSQTAAIEWNTVTEKSFTNILKKWNVTVTKTDASTGTAQGNGSLAGAQYGIYKGDELIDTYTTDANGQFTTGYYVCGDNWTIREIAPSEGYLLDTTVYPVGAEAKKYTVELNSTNLTVLETVKKGSIAIIKHSDNGDTQIETPEAGAEFCVYLKSAGSYDAAAESERDYLTCDENGFAQTKELPYGLYTVHQVSGWDGRELMADFDVFISDNGEVYRYLINNAAFESFLKVIKVDAETGKTIPYAGAAFQIHNPDGTLVKQTFTYPEVTEIDTFYTNEDGYLITPESLEYGTGYALVEVKAPYGYVINSEPVYFDVTQDDSTEEGGITVIEVTKANTAQKGTIRIHKTGEVFATVHCDADFYVPVYKEQGLPGAVFEITAAEDIYTLDGTLRYTAGEVVDTITTDGTGYATSKALYLGRFHVTEITAPAGMVINTEPHTVELVYANQEVEISETAASFTNKRQKVSVSMIKILEQNNDFHIGMNGEITAVTFGLYAAEELTAADGSTIPTDGLIEILSVNEDGKASCQADLPFGSFYLKELTTDSHYILTDEKYPFTFTDGGAEQELIEIIVNSGEPIVNELIYGQIDGLKLDDEGNGLAGAVIGLFGADETEFTADTAILTTVTVEHGYFHFAQVPYGNWIVREIAAPDGYVLSDTQYPVTIAEDGTALAIQITNVRILGAVQLTKVDKDYPENKLTGAEFQVYRDTNGDRKLDADDEHLGALAEISTGIYQIDKLVYGGYFVQETKAPDGFYLDSNAYYFEITQHGELEIVENEAGKGFINAAQVGSLRIIKTSSDGKVEGFSFRVIGPNGYNKVFTTGQNGEIVIEGLRIGEYTVSEVANEKSENYVLPADKDCTIFEGAATKVEMHNELRDTPKTGDDSNPVLWMVLMGVSGAAAIACAVCIYKKSRKK